MPHVATRSLLSFTLCALIIGCEQTPRDNRPTVRLNPTESPAGDPTVAKLFDRDTTTFAEVPTELRLPIGWSHAVELRELRVHGGENIEVEFEGASVTPSSATEWERTRWKGGHSAERGTLILRPRGASARIAEVELWGAGLPSAPRDPIALAVASDETLSPPFENVLVTLAAPANAELTPMGMPEAEPCATFRFETALVGRPVERALLAYRATGALRSISFRRSLNGAAPIGGLWLQGGQGEHTLIDELDPERLSGRDQVTLCLPSAAPEPVQVRNVRLILELDDGSRVLDRESAARLAAAWDNEEDTAQAFSAEPLELRLERPVVLDSAALKLDTPSAQLTATASAAGVTHVEETLPLLGGWNRVPLAGVQAERITLQFAGSPRPDLPAAKIAELRLSGSTTGPRVAVPRLVISYPSLRHEQGRWIGERFGAEALISGWTESPGGPAQITLDGAPIGFGDGGFSSSIDLSDPEVQTAELRATFPDGTVITRTIHFEDDREVELNPGGSGLMGSALSSDGRFGQEGATSWDSVDPERGGKVRLGTRVGFDAPPGAVKDKTSVGIARKGREVVPRLDPGMVNVTAPSSFGYRFLPAGKKFEKPVQITLPYDPLLLPEGMGPAQVLTYYFDRGADRWVALPRKAVLRTTEQIVSETTHFTFMINAVLVVPEHPGTVSFNPNSIKDLKAADPSANIDFITPPEANSQGTAQVGFPIRLPPARGSYQPSISLRYDSGGGNGWLGVGWEVPISSLEVDTRFGVPNYDGKDRYLLDGQALIPLEVSGAKCLAGEATVFVERVVRSFSRILRCVDAPATATSPGRVHWEVTGTDGTLYVYGYTPEARLENISGPGIAQWMIERVVDPNNHLTLFTYHQDSKGSLNTTSTFAANNGLDWRRIYPCAVKYAVRVTDPLAEVLPTFPYTVLFVPEKEPDGVTWKERPDISTAARAGFKVATRFRLGGIQVRLEVGELKGVIREYRLQYTQELMRNGVATGGRSLLEKIQVYGAGPNGGMAAGPLFYEHVLDYFRSDENTRGFEYREWHLPSSTEDKHAITSSIETGTEFSTYVGLAPPLLPVKALSAGRSSGNSTSERETRAQLVDLNGDGLPDRFADGTIWWNQSANGGPFTFSTTAPAGDPAAGQTVAYAGEPVLSFERSEGTHSAWEGHAVAIHGSLGDNTNRSDSLRMLADANGDGFVDLVSSGGVQFGQPRNCRAGETGCCPVGEVCFTPGTLASVSEANRNLATNPIYQAIEERLRAREQPMHALLRWEAPYPGTINVGGVAARVRANPNATGPLSVSSFWQRWGEQSASALASIEIGPSDLEEKQLASQTLNVVAGDVLYFKAGGGNWPASGFDGEGRSVNLDEVRLLPVIAYTHRCTVRSSGCTPISPEEAATVDITGASLFRFHHAEDFRIAGGPPSAMQIPVGARIAVSGTATKDATHGGARVCILKTAKDVGPALGATCAESADAVYRHDFGANASSTSTSWEAEVEAGTWLVLRIESDLPIDPASLSWLPRITYQKLCDGGVCRALTPSEQERLDVSGEPYFVIHHVRLTAPPQAHEVKLDGKVALISTAGFGPFPLSKPVHFMVTRASGEVVFTAAGAHQDVKTEVSVTRGERLLFWAHADTEGPYWVEWTPRLETLAEEPVEDRVNALNVSHDLPETAFSGGHRGWGYGEWNGLEPFDPARIAPWTEGDWEGMDPESAEYSERIAEELRDPDTSASLALKTFSALVARSGGSSPQGTPVWASADGSLFVSSQGAAGAVRGSRRPDVSRALALGLSEGGAVRSSLNDSSGGSLSLGISFLGYGVSWSSGETVTGMDALDLNADGLLDAVAGGKVWTADRRDLGALGASFQFEGDLRRNSTFSLQFSPGVSIPGPDPKASGSTTEAGVVAVANAILGQSGFGTSREITSADLIDVNGDGLPDRVERDPDAEELHVRLNLGGRFATDVDKYPLTVWTEKVDGFVAALDPTVEDGLGESTAGELRATDNANNIRANSASTITHSWGAGAGGGGFSLGGGLVVQSSLAKTSVDMIDVNGDGLPDIVKKSTRDEGLQVQLNTGTGFLPPEMWSMPAWPLESTPKFRANDFQEMQLDFYRAIGVLEDGSVDELSVVGTHSDPTNFSLAGAIPFDISWLCPICPAAIVEETVTRTTNKTGFELGFEDLDGDGCVDHVLKHQDKTHEMFARMNKSGATPIGLLRSIRQPLGGSVELTYARVGNTVDLPQARWVMKTRTVRDGRGMPGQISTGHDFGQTYSYTGGYYDRDEKDFLGFSDVTIQQSIEGQGGDGSQRVQKFENGDPWLKGMLVSETLLDRNEVKWAETVNTLTSTLHIRAGSACESVAPYPLSKTGRACESRFPFVSQTTKKFYEGGSTFKEAIQKFVAFDAYGNVTQFEDLGDDQTTADDLVAKVAYSGTTDPYLRARHIVDRPTSVTAEAADGTVLRRRTASYDANGNLRFHTADIDSLTGALTELVWERGRLNEVIGPPNENDDRYSLTYGYEDEAHTHVTTVTDSHGLVTTFKPNLRFGEPEETTDVAGNKTVRKFDAFGRLTQLFGPYDIDSSIPTVSVTYGLGSAAKPAFAVTRNKLPPEDGSANLSLDNVVFLDGMSRVIQTRAEAEVDGALGVVIAGDVRRDAMGRVLEQGQRRFVKAGQLTDFDESTPVLPTTFAYDILGRTRSAIDPDLKKTAFEYSLGTAGTQEGEWFKTVVTDAEGNKRTLLKDVLDRTVAVVEHIYRQTPTTKYAYLPTGELSTITDAKDNVITSTYDLLGRRRTLETPDAGLTTYRYDPAGNLVAKITPELERVGAEILYSYEFNRLKRVDHPYSADVEIDYGNSDAVDNSAGRIVEVRDEAGRENRAYGKLGETVLTRRAVRAFRPGDVERTFETRYAFDSFGRMLALTYPDGETVRYKYNAGGLVESVTGERTPSDAEPIAQEKYVERILYDHFGQRTEVRYGNGVLTTYAHDPETRRLETLTTTTPKGRTLQAISYGYDDVGNIESMVNALGRPVGDRSGRVSYTFRYDPLYRLTYAKGVAAAREGVIDQFVSKFKYDEIHNMTSNHQHHEVVEGSIVELPPKTNHDFAYVYGDTKKPHQATQIGDTRLEYDLNGNTARECRVHEGVACDANSDHLRTYEWTEENWLRSVVDGGGRNVTRFFYDSAGERVVKLGQGGTSITVGQFFSLKGRRYATKHIFAGDTRVATKLSDFAGIAEETPPDDVSGPNLNGCEPSDYQPQKCPPPAVFANALVLEPQRVKPATYYYHPDHLGSTSWMTDQYARVHEHIEYFPYGAVWREAQGDRDDGVPRLKSDPFLFTGKVVDPETGLQYFGARYFDSLRVRWTNVDPIVQDYLDGAPAGGVYETSNLALYSYAWQNPIVVKDSDGRFAHLIGGAVVGGLAGGGIYLLDKYMSGEEITVRGLLGHTAGGALTGTMIAATGPLGLSVSAQAAVAGTATVQGGILARVVEGDPSALAPEKIATDYAAGVGGDLASRLLGKAVRYFAARGGFIDPKAVRFSQDSIKSSFRGGGSIDELAEGLRSGTIKPGDVPAIRVFERDGNLFTLDNRRLEAFRRAGVEIPYRQATPEEIANEAWKFTTKNAGESIRVRGE